MNHYSCSDSLCVLSQHRLFFPTIKAHPWRRACPPKPQCRLSFPGLLQPPSFQSRHVLNILVLIRYLRAKIKASFVYCGRGRLWLVKTTFTACMLFNHEVLWNVYHFLFLMADTGPGPPLLAPVQPPLRPYLVSSWSSLLVSLFTSCSRFWMTLFFSFISSVLAPQYGSPPQKLPR